jgi:hypothetical protein
MSGRHHAVGFSPTVLITVEQKTIIKMRSPVPVIIEKKRHYFWIQVRHMQICFTQTQIL